MRKSLVTHRPPKRMFGPVQTADFTQEGDDGKPELSGEPWGRVGHGQGVRDEPEPGVRKEGFQLRDRHPPMRARGQVERAVEDRRQVGVRQRQAVAGIERDLLSRSWGAYKAFNLRRRMGAIKE